ncbi:MULTISPECIES: TIGR02300 family protein [Pacificibacter]|uniref:TIGR02300 family protein n=1 Tax=Pacificibacter TaxID=1042323 RepID=UPI001C089C02|nr:MULTISPECIES: TIGR02300 family protein [Pacificibacter]MBU2937719.1 TIGR02300 family protein [Pacificibacter marinus]MDO6616213.1 TIGR02300 family protein [Pacificibacter sp. 1_MG-2023]
MPNEEWGVKRLCPTSGKRFYDLNKDPIVSPYTGEVVTFDANNKSRVEAAEKKAPVEDEVDEVDELLVVDDDEDIDIDDDLLEDDDDDNVSLDEIADVAADDDE